MRQLNHPRLGKKYIRLGIIATTDQQLVNRQFVKHKIEYQWMACTYPRLINERDRKKFHEVFVKRGHKREALQILKGLFNQRRA